MQNYLTVKDKAAEWNLSSRHVQYLCRSGKIVGAIKRAEVWFIPADTPSPAIKTKPGGAQLSFVGTKRNIFYCAIELFMTKGYDSVSLRDIASKAGIRQSTIYNHFKSKQEILDTIYDFYCLYYLKDRPSMEDMAAMIEKDSLAEIIRAIVYQFREEYIQELFNITEIIFQRICVDSRAREVAKTLMMEEGIKYVEAVFNMGIRSERFAPFDTHLMAVFINSIRVYTMYHWIIDPTPEGMKQVNEDERALYKYAEQFVKDRLS